MRIILTLLITFFASWVSAQKLDYNGIRTGTLKMLINEYDVFELGIASMALEAINSKSTDYIEWGKKILKDFPRLKESVEASRIGNVELINCQVNFIVDTQEKLTIRLETEDGKTMLEFGKSKHQDLSFMSEEDEKGFYIAIGDLDNEVPIGAIELDEYGDTKIYTGNLTYIGDIEVTYLEANKELATKNIEVIQQLKQKIQKLFKPDEDGMLILECE